jgi:hypothetical protein
MQKLHSERLKSALIHQIEIHVQSPALNALTIDIPKRIKDWQRH